MKLQQTNARARRKAGMTLPELLVAMLIMLMVAGVMAAAIPAAQRAMVSVKNYSNAQLTLSTAIAEIRKELGSARNLSLSGTKLSYTSGRTQAGTELEINTEKQILVNGRPLLNQQIVTKELTLICEGLTYENGIVTFQNLKVNKGGSSGQTLASLDSYQLRAG